MIFAVVNTKGGVGKTTLAVHLAAMLMERGSTLIIDGDPQESAACWVAWRKEGDRDYPTPAIRCLTGKAILDQGRPLAAHFENTVIDAGGRDSAGLRSALVLAQRAVIPIGTSNLDVAAMSNLSKVIATARDYNPNLDVRVLLTRIDPRSKDTTEMRAFLRDAGHSVLDSHIGERIAFRRATGDGLTVSEYGRDPTAITEMTAFFNETTAASSS